MQNQSGVWEEASCGSLWGAWPWVRKRALQAKDATQTGSEPPKETSLSQGWVETALSGSTVFLSVLHESVTCISISYVSSEDGLLS